MTLPSWDSLPIRTKRSRKRLYGVIANEYSLTAWKSLPLNVKRSKKHLYNYIASAKNLEEYDELAKKNMRSTRLLYNYIKENASGSKSTLTITVNDGTDAISGATVVIGEESETTGADGKATFTLPYDDYSVSISATGFESATETLQFRSNHKSFTVSLTATGGTGTVTTTVLYGETPQIEAVVYLCTNDTIPSEDDSMVVAMGFTDDNGVTTLRIYDLSTHRPTSETAIPYDDYYLIAMDSDAALTPYDEPFTVDGDEEVTITLTD